MGSGERGGAETEAMHHARYEGGRWSSVDATVIRESAFRIHVNGLELATLMCTPADLDHLALGFLRSEGIIESVDDIRLLKLCPGGTCVDVWLRRANFEPPTRTTITSGCGGGVTFADLSAAGRPLESDLHVTATGLCKLIGALQEAGRLYREARGVHSAGLATAEAVVAIAEDVGRHNAIDKLWGRCLAERIPTEDRILLTSGRISSEMLRKAAMMRVPIIASRTSPTSLSVQLAEAWNVTIVGYVRRDSLNVYSGQDRIIDREEEQRHANS